MQFKGVRWAATSLFVFSLAAYFALPTYTPSTIQTMSTASVTRAVTKKVLAIETPEGDGAMVRRSIGSAGLRNLTPFLMLDHFHAETGGFPDHPHRGQSTVTYMLQGSSSHEYSVGHKGTIETGGVQWMVAVSIVSYYKHDLYSVPTDAVIPDLRDVHPLDFNYGSTCQKKYKMVEPSYQELTASGIPTAYPEGPDGPVRVKVISGLSHGVESPVRPLGGCWYFHYIFSKDQVSVFQDLPSGWTAFIYVLKGSLIVGNESIPQEQYHTLVLSANSNETGVLLKSGSEDTEFMLAAAEPIDEPIVQYGPFVMNTKEEIMQTLQDYREGRNGFESAHTWQSKNAH
ncbi:Pirin domain-containing protein [Mycena sanguinolenta]|uniref:Pirin domain-containing protein n=1 Tax=Mycena sanguinolenta TaxID=230812 RepID=A0A8H6YAG4_9AGAR|nr:Pirin domain-containing protein [Mycena sanguinolenta]